ERVIRAVKSEFSPEFINRIDDIIVFTPFEKEDLLRISRRELEKLGKRAERLGMELKFSEDVVEAVAMTKGTERYGARPIKRRVTELIENELALMLVNGTMSVGDKIKVEMDNGKVKLTKCVAV
ncbi:MAG: ATP-dependent Clp protease ATP-binding subunit, partial [Ruminococcus sp.]|nr:ATP-dependent Clp protease ATP-binding subunit [Ruminococcus sp.]